MDKIEPIDFNDIKHKLFESGDYLPFNINECSDKPVNNFLISETLMFDNPMSIGLLDEDDMLWEGLIRTYPIETLKKYVCRTLQFNEKQFQIKEKNGQKCASIYYRYDEETKKWIIKAMNLGGYYMSQEIIGKGTNEGLRELRFESKFEDDIYTQVIESCKVLYHVTEKKNINRIRHIGICSRSNCSIFDYPARIYLLKDSVDKQFILSLAKSLSVSKYGKNGHIDYSLITINPRLLPKDTRFYEDVNLPQGIFMYGNISPKCIIDIKDLDI